MRSILAALALWAALAGAPQAQTAQAAQTAPPAPPAPAPLTLDLPAAASPAADASAPGTGSVYFVGTATVIIRHGSFTLLTDPNFLHKGELAPLGYGLRSPRLTEPAIDIGQLPPVDLVLLSHYHGDHFDPTVEARLDKRLPIVTTAHAAHELAERGFTQARPLQTWQALEVRKGAERLRITAMPGRHGPRLLAAALPPVMGSLVEFLDAAGRPVYRLYISGDTLVHDALADIPKRFPGIDLALLHLGGTRIFGVLVTMDAAQGVQALRLLQPELAVPIHHDDYAVFKSPLADFQAAVQQAGLADRVHYLARGETLRFADRPPR